MIMVVASLAGAIVTPMRRVVIKEGAVLRTHLVRATPLSISSVEMDSGSPGPLSHFANNPRVARTVEVLRQVATPKISPSPDRS